MRHRGLNKRLSALEKALAPPPKIYWAPWQKILTEAEHDLVVALARRGARPKSGGGAPFTDDPEAWTALCADDRERALLAQVMTKAENPAFPLPWNRMAYPLYLYLLDWQL